MANAASLSEQFGQLYHSSEPTSVILPMRVVFGYFQIW